MDMCPPGLGLGFLGRCAAIGVIGSSSLCGAGRFQGLRGPGPPKVLRPAHMPSALGRVFCDGAAPLSPRADTFGRYAIRFAAADMPSRIGSLTLVGNSGGSWLDTRSTTPSTAATHSAITSSASASEKRLALAVEIQ